MTTVHEYALIGMAIFCVAVAAWAVFSLRKLRRKEKMAVRPTSPVEEKVADATDPKVAARVEEMVRSDRQSLNALGWPTPEAAGDFKKSEYVLGHGKTILIADDDPVVSLALSRRLEHLGYQVFRTTDAAHALFGTKKLQPDLAILDFEMPSGNGLAVCEMLASDHTCSHIPIIVHSSFIEENVKQRCRELNAHYVHKSPQSWQEIKELVESLLAEPPPETPPQSSGSSAEPAPASPPQEPEASGPEPSAPKPSARKSSARKPSTPEPSAPKPSATETPSGNTPSTAPPEEYQVVTPWEHKAITVLCIDDDPVIIRTIAMRLQPYGIKVRGVDNGTQGYLSAVSDPPDLILLDLKMPNGQGDYVIGKLKDNPYTRNIPVIIVTIESTGGILRRMTSLGAESLVTKPINWPELFAHMGRCVQLPHQLLHDYNLPEQLTVRES